MWQMWIEGKRILTLPPFHGWGSDKTTLLVEIWNKKNHTCCIVFGVPCTLAVTFPLLYMCFSFSSWTTFPFYQWLILHSRSSVLVIWLTYPPSHWDYSSIVLSFDDSFLLTILCSFAFHDIPPGYHIRHTGTCPKPKGLLRIMTSIFRYSISDHDSRPRR